MFAGDGGGYLWGLGEERSGWLVQLVMNIHVLFYQRENGTTEGRLHP